jgi:diphthamide biosynthesis protein 4
MAPSPLKKEPSHFEVLSLTPTSLDGQDPPTQTKTVKQAYRRALLRHHPDKSQQAKAQDAPSDPSSSSSSSKSKSSNGMHYTVDQITEAYTVLSDTRQRREYVRSLKTESHSTSGAFTTSSNSSSSAKQNYTFNYSSNGDNGSSSGTKAQSNQPQSSTGVESIDLDDVAWDGRKQLWHHACGRCGTDRGYCFRELDLDEVGEDGELMVQCTGCSLWLRVLFDEAEEDGEEEEVRGDRDVRSQRSGSQGGGDLRHTTSGSSAGKSGGWSWKFNIGISLGGSASASASAGRK